jgi:hypothetical protein
MEPDDHSLQEANERKAKLDAARAVLSLLNRGELLDVLAEFYDRVSVEIAEHKASISAAQRLTVDGAGEPVASGDAALASERDVADECSSGEHERTGEVESSEAPVLESKPEVVEGPPPHLNPNSPRKADQAEAFVWASPSLGGVTAAEVGAATGQDPKAAGAALAFVAKTRGTIFYARWTRRWNRAGSHVWIPRKTTLRDLIVETLSKGTPVGTGGIFYAVRAVRPSVEYPSVAAEVARMRRDRLLTEAGWGGRGALYTLATKTQVDTVPTHVQVDSTPSVMDGASVAEQPSRPILNGGARTLHPS